MSQWHPSLARRKRDAPLAMATPAAPVAPPGGRVGRRRPPHGHAGGQAPGYQVPRENNIAFLVYTREQLSERIFGCRPCSYLWCQQVPLVKPVSSCRRCRTCYDPIPVEQEPIGKGKFHCQCGHVWTSPRAHRTFPQPCQECHQMVVARHIQPHPWDGQRPQRQGVRQSPRRHNCSACGGEGQCPLRWREPPPSVVHDCDGDTFTMLTGVSDFAPEASLHAA